MKTLLLAITALLLANCAELDTAFEVLDVLMTPTDRQICESDQVGGKWLDGECYTAKKECAGKVVDGACYEKRMAQ